MSEIILHFTDKAVEHINKALTRYPQGGFRLSVKKAGCTGNKYIPEIVAAAQPGDIEFKTPQGLLVFVEPRSIAAVRGTTVDLVQKGLGQRQLVFINPNAVGECGCGESFHLREDENG